MEKLIICCRVLGRGDKDDEDSMGAIKEDIFLSQLENMMLNSVRLRGVKDIKHVFLLEHDKVTISDEGNIEARKEKLIQTAALRSSTFGHQKSSSRHYHERTAGSYRVRQFLCKLSPSRPAV